MGFNFRGSKKANFSTENQHGFQEKSAPGPRRGVGGDQPYAADAAKKRFSKPLSIKVSTNPITQRAKPSPLKMNEALVLGARNTGKKFVDAGAEVKKAFATKDKKPATANLGRGTHLGDKKTKTTNVPVEDITNKSFAEIGKIASDTNTGKGIDEYSSGESISNQTNSMFGGDFRDNKGTKANFDGRYNNMFN